MNKIIDITGKKFSRLTVIKRAKNNRSGSAMWLCRCDCGKEKVVLGRYLRFGITKSCGCLQKEIVTGNSFNAKHRLINNPLYKVWADIKTRCYNVKRKAYKDYGGRGITVCNEWYNDFQTFYDWAMSNGYKEGLSIDRIDNNGNYEPNNCRWANRVEQNNNKRNCHYITYNKKTHTIAEWERITGISQDVIYDRLKLGWTIERALTTKVRQRKTQVFVK